LYDVISKPEIMAMFNASACKLSLFDCLQSGKIVLVNSGLASLGIETSELLGRYFISQTLTAAYTRITVPKSQWRPAFLFIDEFQDFADPEMTPRMLRLAREYNLGIFIAHQNMYCEELDDKLRTAISTNTTVKYCAKPEGLDKAYMLRDFGCDAEFLDKQVTNKSLI
jgi:hypothetical protein